MAQCLRLSEFSKPLSYRKRSRVVFGAKPQVYACLLHNKPRDKIRLDWCEQGGAVFLFALKSQISNDDEKLSFTRNVSQIPQKETFVTMATSPTHGLLKGMQAFLKYAMKREAESLRHPKVSRCIKVTWREVKRETKWRYEFHMAEESSKANPSIVCKIEHVFVLCIQICFFTFCWFGINIFRSSKSAQKLIEKVSVEIKEEFSWSSSSQR